MNGTERQESDTHLKQNLEITPHTWGEKEDFDMIWEMMEDDWRIKQNQTVHQSGTQERPTQHERELFYPQLDDEMGESSKQKGT